MSNQTKTNPETKITKFKPKTPEMEQFLQAGYPDMSVQKAKHIISEWEGDKGTTSRYPYEVYEKAKAFMAAYEGAPEAVSKEPGWKRIKVS